MNNKMRVQFYDSFPMFSLEIMAGDYDRVFTLHMAPQNYLRPVSRDDLDCYKLGITESTTELGTVLGEVLTLLVSV